MNAFDMTASIEPKSDQANAEDFLTGPRTFTIAEVRKGSTEQPVEVVLEEFPHDRPFKPSKTVRRIMVHAWGKHTSAYVGKRITLYRDPTVKFGGMDVGGIRVSHMSGITKAFTVALTVSRGKRAPYVVQPLPDAPAAEDAPVAGHGRRRAEMLLRLGQTGRRGQAAADYISAVCDRSVTSPTDLSDAEIETVIAALRTIVTPQAEDEQEPPPSTGEHDDRPMSAEQRGMIFAQFEDMGIGDDADAEVQRNYISDVIQRPCTEGKQGRNSLTVSEARAVIEAQIETLDAGQS